MTSPTTKRQRHLTADRLYTAAILIGAMLVPHLTVALVGSWPAQPFTLHAFVVLLLVGSAWRVEFVEATSAKPRKAKPKRPPTSRSIDNTFDDFEEIARRLRSDES